MVQVRHNEYTAKLREQAREEARLEGLREAASLEAHASMMEGLATAEQERIAEAERRLRMEAEEKEMQQRDAEVRHRLQKEAAEKAERDRRAAEVSHRSEYVHIW